MTSSLLIVPRCSPEQQRPLVEAAAFSTAGASLQEDSRRKPSSPFFLELGPPRSPTHAPGGCDLARRATVVIF